jgi:hypothetical protein
LPPVDRRRKLAQVAREEPSRELRSAESGAGPDVEHYLGVFREALNLNTGTDWYSDPAVGYRPSPVLFVSHESWPETVQSAGFTDKVPSVMKNPCRDL